MRISSSIRINDDSSRSMEVNFDRGRRIYGLTCGHSHLLLHNTTHSYLTLSPAEPVPIRFYSTTTLLPFTRPIRMRLSLSARYFFPQRTQRIYRRTPKLHGEVICDQGERITKCPITNLKYHYTNGANNTNRPNIMQSFLCCSGGERESKTSSRTVYKAR